MSAPGPQWSPWWAPPRGRDANAETRVSDAERSEVADALSKHYSEGRLDQAELDERLQKAMAAKTRRDLAGLLVDLPSLAPPPSEGHVRRGPGHVVLLVIALWLLVVAVSSTMWAWHVPWLLLAVAFFFLWRRSRWRGWRGRRHRAWEPPGERGDEPGGMALRGTSRRRTRTWWV